METNEIIKVIIMPIITLFLGWFLSAFLNKRKRKIEDKKKINIALFQMLKIRHKMFFLNNIIRIAFKSAPSMVEIEKIRQRNFDKFLSKLKNDDSITDIASVDAKIAHQIFVSIGSLNHYKNLNYQETAQYSELAYVDMIFLLETTISLLIKKYDETIKEYTRKYNIKLDELTDDSESFIKYLNEDLKERFYNFHMNKKSPMFNDNVYEYIEGIDIDNKNSLLSKTEKTISYIESIFENREWKPEEAETLKQILNKAKEACSLGDFQEVNFVLESFMEKWKNIEIEDDKHLLSEVDKCISLLENTYKEHKHELPVEKAMEVKQALDVAREAYNSRNMKALGIAYNSLIKVWQSIEDDKAENEFHSM